MVYLTKGGKSAVMDAIILCLGGRAAATGRQASAKTFIKTNSEYIFNYQRENILFFDKLIVLSKKFFKKSTNFILFFLKFIFILKFNLSHEKIYYFEDDFILMIKIFFY